MLERGLCCSPRCSYFARWLPQWYEQIEHPVPAPAEDLAPPPEEPYPDEEYPEDSAPAGGPSGEAEVTGIDLARRELGAQIISEIDT